MNVAMMFGLAGWATFCLTCGCAPVAGTVDLGKAPGASSSPTIVGGALPVDMGAQKSSSGHELLLVNRCQTVLWANNGAETHLLAPGQSRKSTLPHGFGGRVWARGDCAIIGPDEARCETDIPLTLAEFKLDGWMEMDFYDVSLVDAFNLPMAISPQGGHGDCKSLTCAADLLASCPSSLQQHDAQGKLVACLSGCQKEKTDAACCQNGNGTAESCPQPPTAVFFKTACPAAYSYAFDDATSVATCVAPTGYVVTFCP